MDPVALVVVSVIALAGGVATAAAWLDRRLRKEWTCTCEGRTIRLVARQSRKELFVDGERVAAKTTLSGAGASLSWRFQGETGPPLEVTAVIVYTGATPTARILANGAWIGGDAHAEIAGVATEPTDPRWAAARVLLADLRGVADPRLREAAGRVEAALRDLLGRHARLATARSAHATLGGDPGEIDSAQARLDGRISELVDAVRQLHLASVAQGPPTAFEPIDELIGRIVADAEVEGLERPRRPASPISR